MIYWDYVIDKMAIVYQRSFPVRSKNEFITLLRVSYCWYLKCLERELSVEQSNVYFTVIGQALQLWQFESRLANSRNLRAFLIHFIPDPVFWIMRV